MANISHSKILLCLRLERGEKELSWRREIAAL